MKKATIAQFIGCLIALPMGIVQAAGVLTFTPVTHVYSPKGFDTNDEAQVIVSGYLPNLCYKAQRSQVSVSGNVISITVKALFDGRLLCPQVMVPFLEVVSVGTLDKGTYQVVVNGGSAQENYSKIAIVKAPQSSVDNYVYANVSYIEKIEGSRRILLKGTNPSDCFELDRIEFVSNGTDTYSVLPILKQVRSDCPKKLVPFSIEAEVPRGLSFEEPLLHVRVMDGKSVNLTFEN